MSKKIITFAGVFGKISLKTKKISTICRYPMCISKIKVSKDEKNFYYL